VIVTVTLNPADDVTYEVASMNPGELLESVFGGNPSGVRISYPPPPLTRQYTRPVMRSSYACKEA